MADRYIKWDKLDNTANLFPVIAGEKMTNTYRISVVLTEEIQPELLQEALDMVTPKIPGFNLRLRSGIFWYYFEENGKKAPRVREESTYPCRLIHQSKNNSYLFRVTYYRKRINLEVFHVLTDGMGGITFLRELTYQYLRLAHPDLREQMGDGLSADTSLNREDSFRKNFKKSQKSAYKSQRAFLIGGERLAYDGFGVITRLSLHCPVEGSVQALSGKYQRIPCGRVYLGHLSGTLSEGHEKAADPSGSSGKSSPFF